MRKFTGGRKAGCCRRICLVPWECEERPQQIVYRAGGETEGLNMEERRKGEI